MLKIGDRSTEVTKLQQALLTLGVSLPRWGADGDLGDETMDAVGRLLGDHGVAWPDDAVHIDDKTLAYIYQLLRDVGTTLGLPAGGFDARELTTDEDDYGKRPWSSITGITLHQTACHFGEVATNWRSVGAHIGVTRGGRVLFLHDLNRLIVHANQLNTRTVGIEMEGRYAGVEGNDRTFWRPANMPQLQPDTPTVKLIEASKEAIRFTVKRVAKHGGKVTKLFAHRQTKAARQSDPGSALWQSVALPMMAELGLDDGGVGFKVPNSNGLAIPESWDPRCKGIKY